MDVVPRLRPTPTALACPRICIFVLVFVFSDASTHALMDLCWTSVLDCACPCCNPRLDLPNSIYSRDAYPHGLKRPFTTLPITASRRSILVRMACLHPAAPRGHSDGTDVGALGLYIPDLSRKPYGTSIPHFLSPIPFLERRNEARRAVFAARFVRGQLGRSERLHR